MGKLNKFKSDITILIIFGIGYLLIPLLNIALGIGFIESESTSLCYSIIFQVLLFGIVVIFSYKYIATDFKTNYKNLKISKKAKLVLLMLLVKFIAGFLSGIILYLRNIKNVVSDNQVVLQYLAKSYPIIFLLLVCVFAPIIEEYIFRKILYGYFSKIGIPFAIIATGVIFGMLHFIIAINKTSLDVVCVQAINYVSIGVFLGFVRYKYNSVAITMFLHFVNNLLSALAILAMYFALHR